MLLLFLICLKRQTKETYEDVKQLDKSFASIAMVTKYSVNEMWSSYSQYADMASNLGQKTNNIVKASALFYQQGLDTNDALALTTNTMKLATLAGNDFETATQGNDICYPWFQDGNGRGRTSNRRLLKRLQLTPQHPLMISHRLWQEQHQSLILLVCHSKIHLRSLLR